MRLLRLGSPRWKTGILSNSLSVFLGKTSAPHPPNCAISWSEVELHGMERTGFFSKITCEDRRCFQSPAELREENLDTDLEGTKPGKAWERPRCSLVGGRSQPRSPSKPGDNVGNKSHPVRVERPRHGLPREAVADPGSLQVSKARLDGTWSSLAL